MLCPTFDHPFGPRAAIVVLPLGPSFLSCVFGRSQGKIRAGPWDVGDFRLDWRRSLVVGNWRRLMVLLVVLLAQVMPPSHRSPASAWDIAQLHRLWEEQNAACRKIPETDEAQAACYRRDAIGLELGRLGWCARQIGLEIKLEMCPRSGGS